MSDEFTGEDYLKCLEAIRRFVRTNGKRRMFLAFAKADDEGYWLRFTCHRHDAIKDNLKFLRADGWPIERTTVWRLKSWAGVRIADIDRRAKTMYAPHPVKNMAPKGGGTFVWRLKPGFLEGFRLWFYGARQARLVTMLTKKTFRYRSVRVVFRALRMWKLGVIALKTLKESDANRKAKTRYDEPSPIQPARDQFKRAHRARRLNREVRPR